MKKQYTQPELYVETIEVEQGIAMSTQELGGFGDIFLEEEDVEW